MASVRSSLAFVSFAVALFLFDFAVCSAAAVAAPPIGEEKSVRVNNIRHPQQTKLSCKTTSTSACKQENINCSVIQSEGFCYFPFNIVNHASVVMNLYYKMNKQQSSACYFAGTALTVLEDPSYGSCVYA
ncbi:glucan endo-1,3-beta-glucosidase 4-like [Aristolochia californica]|uniref:glucan endo-1,3-beta-glucosidase 4-like n=1 Tax=Aristolochia californica TaxID=171875 RepID=UPI0035D539AB